MAREGERATLGEEAAPLPAGLRPLLLPLPAAAAAAAPCSLAALLYRLEPVSAGGSAAPMCAAPGPARPAAAPRVREGRCSGPSGADPRDPAAPSPHLCLADPAGAPNGASPGIRCWSIPGMRCREHPPAGLAGDAGGMQGEPPRCWFWGWHSALVPSELWVLRMMRC